MRLYGTYRIFQTYCTFEEYILITIRFSSGGGGGHWSCLEASTQHRILVAGSVCRPLAYLHAQTSQVHCIILFQFIFSLQLLHQNDLKKWQIGRKIYLKTKREKDKACAVQADWAVSWTSYSGAHFSWLNLANQL
jgi:hypothetical protein